MTKRVYGRTFEEPSCRYDHLVEPTIRESRPARWSVLMAAIPLLGIGAVVSSFVISVAFHNNRYGGKEAAWRAFVVGSLLQVVSLVVVWIIYLSIRFMWVIA